MKNFTLAIVALALVLTTSAALAQDNMKGHMMNGHMMKVQTHMSGNSMMLKNMMMDLSQDEKRTATNHMNRMTTREKTLMMKRRSMWLNGDGSGMDMSMGRDAQMQHMMSRLSPADRKTMKAMSMKMSPDEKMVDAKMMMSQHGMKHGK